MDVALLGTLARRACASSRERPASVVGPSGFTLFQKLDHGALITTFTGRPTRALTYVFGNALIAIQMTAHEPAVGLYVPLRLYVRESGPNAVLVTYDLPSATLAQFGSAAVDEVARSLDGKVEQLLERARTAA
jgi:uncharacterized protein (DUF302 family)